MLLARKRGYDMKNTYIKIYGVIYILALLFIYFFTSISMIGFIIMTLIGIASFVIIGLYYYKMKTIEIERNEYKDKAKLIATAYLQETKKTAVNSSADSNKIKDMINEKMTEKNVGNEFTPSHSDITLNDIAGFKEVKDELYEIIDFLKQPSKYHSMGATIPHGILFEGPPGTGKTLLARAVAGEAGVKFLYTSGSEFVEKFVGVGAERVRKLFDSARESKEPCIIFIDEIDAMGGKRSSNGYNKESEHTLNQLLVEMDGFTKDNNYIVIAATNRKDMLDSALLRPGRFDRQIYVGLPTYEERIDVLKLHTKNKKIDNLDFESIAKKTQGFSNAELAALMNEAALLAVRFHQNAINDSLIDEAVDRVLMGPSKTTHQYTDKERKIVAYHEAGHAVAGLVLENAKKVEKVTIIPRGEAGGYNLMMPKEETFFPTKGSIHDEIVGLLSGRVAEELFFDDITAGASNDIEKATNLARRYVGSFGMGKMGLMKVDNQASQETQKKLDEEVNTLLKQCHEEATHIIKENKSLLDTIAKSLLEKETLLAQDIEKLYINVKEAA